MTLSDIQPDAGRVIARLSARIGELHSENAQLEDVIRQFVDRYNETGKDGEE